MATFAPTNADICIVRGDSPVIPVQVQDGSGSPLDVSTGTFTLTVDPSDAPSDNTGNLFSVVGSVTDGPNGQVTFQPSDTDTDQAPEIYNYDVQMVLNGSKRTILKGKFEIQQDITKT